MSQDPEEGDVLRCSSARGDELRIGPHVLANRVALAPMAGVTDLPFRRLCHRLGAGLVVSEMLGSNPALRDTRKSMQRRRHAPEIEPRSVQIAGGDPAQVAQAARENAAEGAQIIDINMGCPAKKVCRKAAGSALLRDEALVREILEATVAAVDVPVTLKLRTGWCPESRNGITIARMAEDVGIAALAVHGRTRADRFNGHAEFDYVRRMVAAVDIPVFANGDIDTPERAAQVLAQTGAAGVMVGRAAQGRPWLCGRIADYLATGRAAPEPTLAERGALLVEHVAALHAFHGPEPGLRIARKHVGWAVTALVNGVDDAIAEGEGRCFTRHFNGIETPGAQLAAIEGFFGAARGPTEQVDGATRHAA